MSEPSAAVNIFMNKMNMGDFKEKWSWDAESYGAADRKWEVRNVAEYIYKNRNNKNQATEYYKALSLLPDDYDSLSQSDKNKAFDNARETFEKIYNDQDEDKVLYFVGSSDPNTWLESRNGSSSQGTATPPPIKPIPTVSKEATAQVSSAASTAWKNTLQEDLAGQSSPPQRRTFFRLRGSIPAALPFLTTGFILRQLITARRRFGHRARRTPGASDTRNSPLTRLTSPSTRLSRTATFIYSREPLRPEAGQ